MAEPKLLNSLKMLLSITVVSLFPAGLAFLSASIGSPIDAACWFGGVSFVACVLLWVLVAFRRFL